MSIGAVSSSAAAVAFSLTQVQTAADFAALAVSQDSSVATQSVLAASSALASSPSVQVYSPTGTSVDLSTSLAALGNAVSIAV